MAKYTPVRSRQNDMYLIFSGIPASGKSTLARELAAALNLTFIDKDEILEELFDALGCDNSADRQKLSRASDNILQLSSIRSQRAAIVSFWQSSSGRENSGTPTSRITKLPGPVVEIYCDCSPELAIRRFQRRERHPSNFDGEKSLEEIRLWFERVAADGPIGIGNLVTVDTGSDPVVKDVVAEIMSISSNMQ
jgi:thymidylate kinase